MVTRFFRSCAFLLLALQAPQGTAAAQSANRAWVGIDILGAASGVSVLWVREDSPASTAGLTSGDVIVEIDGQPIAGPDELIFAVAARLPGSFADLTVISGVQSRVVSIRLGRCPDGLILSPR